MGGKTRNSKIRVYAATKFNNDLCASPAQIPEQLLKKLSCLTIGRNGPRQKKEAVRFCERERASVVFAFVGLLCLLLAWSKEGGGGIMQNKSGVCTVQGRGWGWGWRRLGDFRARKKSKKKTRVSEKL
jgi:hypothetical protein